MADESKRLLDAWLHDVTTLREEAGRMLAVGAVDGPQLEALRTRVDASWAVFENARQIRLSTESRKLARTNTKLAWAITVFAFVQAAGVVWDHVHSRAKTIICAGGAK